MEVTNKDQRGKKQNRDFQKQKKKSMKPKTCSLKGEKNNQQTSGQAHKEKKRQVQMKK